MSLLEAAQSDDRATALRRLRDRLAEEIDACQSGRDLASLSQRFMDVVAQLDELEPAAPDVEETGLSEFERRLRERESAAKASRRASGG